ncbi:MAG: UvrD-helicase domain-containing protein, partial [Vulcanibacillus sp.]
MKGINSVDFLKDLNPQQKVAVETIDGAVLLVAGAGSGKTKALTHRIANILRKEAPSNILAITFTNKAAKEMKGRLFQLIGPQANELWISTFHSMCVSILRKDIHHLGYSKSFTILDSADQLNVVKQIMKELNIDIKKVEPRAVLSAISNAKNELKTPEIYGKYAGDFFQKIVLEVFEKYQARLKANNSVDFDDLIMLTVILFRESNEVLNYYQGKFKYIHIDEYQDTNKAQYTLVKMLADYHKNICVVGDTDQSIYRWRGADIKNILSFEKDYPKAKVIMLEQNYRSTKNIINAANAVIKNNSQRKDKNLWTDNPTGKQIVLFRADNEHDEAYFVAEKILEGIEEGKTYRDFAILYRTNVQSRIIEEVFIKSNIPYQIVGGTKFYDRKEIKDIMAYMRLIVNPDDDISLIRIINRPKRGIGITTLDKLSEYAISKQISIFSAIKEIEFVGLGSSTANKITRFADMIIKLNQLKDSLSVTEITEKILEETDYIEDLKNEKSLEAESRIENINELLSVTLEFEKEKDTPTLEDFLSDV